MSKYRIKKEVLHVKKLGKHTLEDHFVHQSQITMGYASNVFHYTSSEGMMGILKGREIFFTDAQFLNDYNERFDINNELKRFWEWHYKEYDKEFYKLVRSIEIKSHEDNDYAYIDDEFLDEPCRYFILSASMDHDSLSMWKYYAKNGTYNGYNVDLFIHALVDEWIDRDTGVAIEIGSVVYDYKEKQKKIHDMIEKLYELWCTYKKSDEMNTKIIKEYKAWISYASLFFKSQYFSAEEEMRFVAIVPKRKLKDLFYKKTDGVTIKMYDFRNVNGVITPFIRMPLFGWNISENWITSNIGIGPCMDYEQKKDGILQFIDSLDYNFNEIRIRQSNIPVRY